MPRLSCCLVLIVLVSTTARADDSEACRGARDLMGAQAARRATAAECQRALDQAEEDQWQLWLDLGLAAEQSGDAEDAIVAYQRFVDAADRRGERLMDPWTKLRDDMRTAIGRLDGDLLQKRARVTITTLPPGATVTVVSGGVPVRGDSERTPSTRYFGKGSHTVRLASSESGASREVRFTVEVGQTLELKVDLRPGAPTDHGVIEGVGPALRGQTPGGAPGTNDPGAGKVIVEVEGPADQDRDPTDDEPPPQTRTLRSPVRTIGIAAAAAGVAALAIGAVFVTSGEGLDDELEACARPGSGCRGTAPELAALGRERDVQYDRATAAFITGGVLVAGGIVAILVFGDETTVEGQGAIDVPGTTRVVPFAGPDGAGVTATMSF